MPIDMSAATVKAPPRKRTASAASTKVTAPATPVATEASATQMAREEGLNGLGQLAQGVCVMVGLRSDAAALGMHWSGVAHETAKLAEIHEEVAKPVDFLIQIGPYTAFVMALLPLGLQIAANHKWVDPANVAGMGVVPPDVLDAQVRANMAQQAAIAMREKQAAIAQAQREQAMYEAQIREAQNEMASQLAEVVA